MLRVVMTPRAWPSCDIFELARVWGLLEGTMTH